MIRINRGPEPARLATVRAVELARVRALSADARSSDAIGTKYNDIRDELLAAQHGKCCWCENGPREGSYDDVDHYRPKAEAQLAREAATVPGYWWLAWSWENLLFACPACNRSHKRVRFWLADPRAQLAAECVPPGSEEALLIDPAHEDPAEHIQFVPSIRTYWRPVPRNGSAKGEATIAMIALARPALEERYGFHVEEYVRPAVGRFLRGGDPDEAASLMLPSRPFSALARDALARFAETRFAELQARASTQWEARLRS